MQPHKVARKWTFEDFEKLCREYITEYESYFKEIEAEVKGQEDLTAAANLFEDFSIDRKLLLLDDADRDVFRQLLIAKGVQWILNAEEIGLDFIQLVSCYAPEMEALLAKWRWSQAFSDQSSIRQST